MPRKADFLGTARVPPGVRNTFRHSSHTFQRPAAVWHGSHTFHCAAAVRQEGLTAAVGGAAALLGVLWYRSIGDWDQRQNTVLDKWQIPVGDWVE